MGFLDNISKTITSGVDRAKFEADKMARMARVQGEMTELRRQIDTRRMELGDRALELYKAGQINSVTLGELAKAIEDLRTQIVVKEEELKTAQAVQFVEPPPTAPTSQPPQDVPISVEPSPPPPQTPPAQPSTTVAKKTCPNCQFQMPATAVFCPNCGMRVGT